jgi:8-oxo-dGTP diphosphatase
MDSQVAVKAVIVNPEGKALIMREGQRWQAPGGRLESGERLRDGLIREVLEETGLNDLVVGKAVHVDEWFSKPEGELKHIVAIFYACRTGSHEIILSGEHNAHAWISREEADDYELEAEMKRAIEIVLADNG